MSAGTLLIVDGMAVLYRAFYAIRELSTSSGRPTNAVYGFIRMLRQMRNAWKPTHAIVMFDGGLPEKRMALLASYKAQRPSMPDALRSQLPGAVEYLEKAGVPWRRDEGQEADDLIASSDKDLFQLVGGTVRMVSVAGDPAAMGSAEVVAKTGMPPEKIVEWLALVGDSADNIPGVPGIGPKTAAKLLTEYGSLENLWHRLDSVHGERIRAALAEHRLIVERNLEMVRLRTDLAAGAKWEDLALRPSDDKALIAFYDAMEFGSLARELREPGLFSS